DPGRELASSRGLIESRRRDQLSLENRRRVRERRSTRAYGEALAAIAERQGRRGTVFDGLEIGDIQRNRRDAGVGRIIRSSHPFAAVTAVPCSSNRAEAWSVNRSLQTTGPSESRP